MVGGRGLALTRGLLLGGLDGTRGQELAHVLWVVGLLVGLKYRRPREGLAAEAAPEGPLARVHPAVVLHVVAQLEGLAAELALEGPVAGVGGQVAYERAHVGEALAAELAEDDPRAGRVGGRTRGRELEVHGLDHEARGVTVVSGLGGGRGGQVKVSGRNRGCRRGLEAQLLGLEQGRLLPVLERLEAVREDVARQLALVEERGTAVHAR